MAQFVSATLHGSVHDQVTPIRARSLPALGAVHVSLTADAAPDANPYRNNFAEAPAQPSATLARHSISNYPGMAVRPIFPCPT